MNKSVLHTHTPTYTLIFTCTSDSHLSEATLSFHKAKTEGNICPALSFGPSHSKCSSKSCALP